MKEEVFDKLDKGEIGGFGAWRRGQVKIQGSVWTALKWDKMVRRYNPGESYTKKTQSGESWLSKNKGKNPKLV